MQPAPYQGGCLWERACTERVRCASAFTAGLPGVNMLFGSMKGQEDQLALSGEEVKDSSLVSPVCRGWFCPHWYVLVFIVAALAPCMPTLCRGMCAPVFSALCLSHVL